MRHYGSFTVLPGVAYRENSPLMTYLPDWLKREDDRHYSRPRTSLVNVHLSTGAGDEVWSDRETARAEHKCRQVIKT